MTKLVIIALKPRPPQEPAEASLKKPVPLAQAAPEPEQERFFQAVGMITGQTFIDGDEAVIKIGSKTYQLAFASAHQKMLSPNPFVEK